MRLNPEEGKFLINASCSLLNEFQIFPDFFLIFNPAIGCKGDF